MGARLPDYSFVWKIRSDGHMRSSLLTVTHEFQNTRDTKDQGDCSDVVSAYLLFLAAVPQPPVEDLFSCLPFGYNV